MDNSEMRGALHRQLRDVQDKYDYWLMTVAGSAIALAVHQTRDARLQYSLIPLGLAVLSWGVSFFAGCRRQLWLQVTLHANYHRLEIEAGIDPDAGTNTVLIAGGKKALERIINEKDSRAKWFARLQFSALIVGVLFYIAWHVAEMWLRTQVVASSQPLH